MTQPTKPLALITGGGRQRLGFVVARYLAEHGYDVALHYHRSQKEALRSRELIQQLGARCETYPADVSDSTAVERMISQVNAQFGRLDLLATTASVWKPIPLDQVSAADLRENFEVNTLGTFLAAKFAGDVMVKQPAGGAIVTFGDWAIERPYLDHAAYFVSKGAIPTLTRVLALELGRRNSNVRVNCIQPGPVMFPPDASPTEKQELVDATLLNRADCPETIAEAVEFLARNQFITGACIPVDGGRHMYSPTDAARTRAGN